jgi:hypothetical protein
MTRQADFKRRVRARMGKTGESYAAARAQLLAERPRDGDALHVTNGDSTVAGLRPLVGDALPWRDVLHDGPVPAVGDAELRRVRAAFLGAERALPELAARDAAFAAHRDGRYVLWFEADLYDQLQLAQILARLTALAVAPERITLICIGEHPGIAHFGGLGELAPAQLAALRESAAAAPLTAAALALGSAAWDAFRAPAPDGLSALARARSPELRFLPEAFDRLGREYPSTRDGLSLTERRILALAAAEARSAGEVFVGLGAREARPYLGDTSAFAAMERLARAPRPLLAAAPLPVGPHTRLALTVDGERVLQGAADQVALRGIDRWIGGVHLHGRAVDWRWDDATEQIVRTRC